MIGNDVQSRGCRFAHALRCVLHPRGDGAHPARQNPPAGITRTVCTFPRQRFGRTPSAAHDAFGGSLDGPGRLAPAPYAPSLLRRLCRTAALLCAWLRNGPLGSPLTHHARHKEIPPPKRVGGVLFPARTRQARSVRARAPTRRPPKPQSPCGKRPSKRVAVTRHRRQGRRSRPPLPARSGACSGQRRQAASRRYLRCNNRPRSTEATFRRSRTPPAPPCASNRGAAGPD